MLTWNRRESTPLSAAPRAPTKDGFFGLINLYLFFQGRVRTEFLYLSLIGIILYLSLIGISIPIRGRGKSPEEGRRWNLAET